MRSFSVLAALLVAGALYAASAAAQQDAGFDSADDARRALAQAQRDGAAARTRAEGLERAAAGAQAEADRTASEAAAAAARIQEAEAQISAREADIRLIDGQREALRAVLAQRQLPVARLTAALERLSRRPLVLSLLRPGSLQDTVHMRAMLETMLPQVRTRTATLRVEIDRGKALHDKAQAAVSALRTEQGELTRRRDVLAALETRQRIALRATSGDADREAERALALAETARDLDGLTLELGKAGALRDELARLPGPILRPANPQAVPVTPATAASASTAPVGAPALQLPVQGRLIAGFGGAEADGTLSRGVSLGARAGAQAVAPGAGRVVFAGPYRGYGAIAIIDHGGGWTTLITGLAQLDVRVGQMLVAGAPLGLAGPGRPVVTLEVRRDGQPVNPLDLIRL